MNKSKDILILNLIDTVNKVLDTSSLDNQIEASTNELSSLSKEFDALLK